MMFIGDLCDTKRYFCFAALKFVPHFLDRQEYIHERNVKVIENNLTINEYKIY